MSAIYEQLANAILDKKARKAVKYVSPKHVVKATRRFYRRCRRQPKKVEIVFTIGSPNYTERKFIKLAQKAGEPFPIKKIQMRFPKA